MAKHYFTKNCPQCGAEFKHANKSVIHCSRKCARRTQFGSFQDRFWSRVSIGTKEECWNWTGQLFRTGYGQIKGHESGSKHAHRISWILKNGEIPRSSGYHGYCVCHTCDNRACVNPNHLFLGSVHDNIKDRDAKKRTARGIKSGTAKLTEEEVLNIRADSSRTIKQTAYKYNVSQSLIRAIKSREIWKHLD